MHAETEARWVPAAVARDILDGTVIPARLPSGGIAVWRSAAGALRANGDRCPHRGMRLSHGFVRGDTLSCIYHGWRFGSDGGCEMIPAHPDVTPPKSINCGPLPVAEANGVAYVATAPLAEKPPVFEGQTALRSMVFAAPEAAVRAMGQGGAEGVQVDLGGIPALLLTVALAADETFVIALVAEGLSLDARLAASAALEALRRGVEAGKAVAA